MKLTSKVALSLVGVTFLLSACGNQRQNLKSEDSNKVSIFKQAKESKENVWFYVRGIDKNSELDDVIFVKDGKIKTYAAGAISKLGKVITLADVQDTSVKDLEKKAKSWNEANLSDDVGIEDTSFKKIKAIEKKGATKTELFDEWPLVEHKKGHIKINGKPYLIYDNASFDNDLNDIESNNGNVKDNIDGYLVQPVFSSKKKAVIDDNQEKGIKLIKNNY